MKTVLACLLFAVAALAQSPERAWEPKPRAREYPWMSLSAWNARHDAMLRRALAGRVDVLFLGDSITEGWGDNAVWQRFYAPRNAANFGIGPVHSPSGRSQQAPSTLLPHSKGLMRRAQYVPVGHGVERSHERGFEHCMRSFVTAATPARFRRQSFQYVMPSQPQSGEPSEGQSTGRCSQRPSESLQAFFWQN